MLSLPGMAKEQCDILLIIPCVGIPTVLHLYAGLLIAFTGTVLSGFQKELELVGG
ncbi:hypothetical protein BaRGS_00025650, partial [Batillaria attramentaria]